MVTDEEQQQTDLCRDIEGMSEEMATELCDRMREAAAEFAQDPESILAGGAKMGDVLEARKLTDAALADTNAKLAHLEQRHEYLADAVQELVLDVHSILDKIVGPIAADWRGDPCPDGDRDESMGELGKMSASIERIETKIGRMDAHAENGGLPSKLPPKVVAAIYTGAAGIVAASLTGAALVISSLLGG